MSAKTISRALLTIAGLGLVLVSFQNCAQQGAVSGAGSPTAPGPDRNDKAVTAAEAGLSGKTFKVTHEIATNGCPDSTPRPDLACTSVYSETPMQHPHKLVFGEDGILRGSMACNALTGRYGLSDIDQEDQLGLQIGELTHTEMACAGLTEEAKLVTRLQAAAKLVQLDNGEILLVMNTAGRMLKLKEQ